MICKYKDFVVNWLLSFQEKDNSRKKERAVPLAFYLCCFCFSVALIVGVPFPFGVLGRMWNSIVSVLDDCIFIYFKENNVLTEKSIMKYFLDEAPGPKKQDCKDRFRSRCLFSFRAASQISEILYLVDILNKLRMISALE